MMKKSFLIFLCLLCLVSFINGSIAENLVHVTPVKIDAGSSDRVHLRSKPSVDASSRGLFFTGTEGFSEEEPVGEWTRVVIGSQNGYIMTKYLRWGHDMDSVQTEQPMGVARTNHWVNIRSAPEKEAEQVGTLRDGDGVTIWGETNTHWYYVATADAIGYVMTDYIKQKATALTPGMNAPDPMALCLFETVLNNEAALYSVSDHRSMYVDDLSSVLQEPSLVFAQFTLADLDTDGENEVVVKLTVEGNEYYGYEILDYRNGQVYGYTLYYRSFQELKADGSFSYASSFDDFGFGFTEFGDTAVHAIHPIAYAKATGTNGISYYSDGTAITQAVFWQLDAAQRHKRAATWQDYTETNIARVFAR